ncbi:MAG: hypothetical protein ABI706_10095 [Ilumatobacteraceae bacterium]
MIAAINTVTLCVSCGARLARDHGGTICSPCRRTQIESAAHCGSVVAKQQSRIQAVFDATGLYGVADQFDCEPTAALDLMFNAHLVPFVSAQRHDLLRRLVALRDLSHVDAAEALNISRWTVATYRSQLGIDRHSSSCARRIRPVRSQ